MSDRSDDIEHLDLICPPEAAGGRLDQVLAELMPERSRAFIRKLLGNGDIRVDGETPKPSRRMRGGERLDISIPPPIALDTAPEDIPLDVLYEDADIVVVNKRPGMVAHPSQGHQSGTLVNALLHHYGDSLSGIGGVVRPGIVHRLDQDTSGCLVAAKNDDAHHALMRQFMDRDVEKTYLAVTDGAPRPVSGKVEGNIGRSTRDRKKHAMLKSGGRHSLTLYRTLENYGALALVECDLKTGRTHQARVHLAHVGAPVLCDRDYGKRDVFTRRDCVRGLELFRFGEVRGGGSGNFLFGGKSADPDAPLLSRQALHAWKLAFDHPREGRRLEFEAPTPDDMLAVLAPFRAAMAEMNGSK